ncbi:hypothetical protein niasHT_020010 [Heterodera trifolii]|uniref:Uncharacterized protein n=1 Tax=Heterodera trifolii TaxID=157864 RepID=A0ABD2L609_9BILA
MFACTCAFSSNVFPFLRKFKANVWAISTEWRAKSSNAPPPDVMVSCCLVFLPVSLKAANTAKRGHYVNKGPLEFRQIDFDQTTSEEDEEKVGEEESNGMRRETSILEADEEEAMNGE